MAIMHVNNDNFEDTIKSNNLTFVDFFATWCGPCKMLTPILDEISNERNDVVIAKVDIDESMDIAQKFGIMSVPTMILFKNGEEVDRAVGFRMKEQINNIINAKLN